jgi:hypothetical protein
MKVSKPMKKWAILLLWCLGCGESSVDEEPSTENTAALCSDGIDNDGDGSLDCDDLECRSFCQDAGDTEPIETDTGSTDPDARHMLLKDEGNSQLQYVDLGAPENNWHVDVPAGRDMQLVGSGLVMIGTENKGYEERDIATGEKVNELIGFNGAIAARRLRNHNTMLVGTDWQDQTGIVLLEVDESGETVRTINYPDYTYARLVRQTAAGTFLVTSDKQIIELDGEGNLLWEATVYLSSTPHAWMALRLDAGETVVSCGYAANLQFFDESGDYLRKITGGADDVRPFFYAGFQILNSGNYVVTNWQDHGTGHGDSGLQVLEYDPSGNLVWYWKQDPTFVSSLQGVIVLDGLDLNKLHVEGPTGALEPVD